jgi:hypothetical protein
MPHSLPLRIPPCPRLTYSCSLEGMGGCDPISSLEAPTSALKGMGVSRIGRRNRASGEVVVDYGGKGVFVSFH